MQDWTDNDRNDFEPITLAVGEVLRESLDDAFHGVVTAACGVFHVPAAVLGHARRGLRDMRAELKKWQQSERPE
ncbi:MAG: hypothetical protein GY838_12970 [bacterium]|nr:hypothetical protein [bacterium]